MKHLFILLLFVFSSTSIFSQIQKSSVESDLKFFQDPTCSKLKKGVKLSDLDQFQSSHLKSVAQQMLDGSFDPTYRIADYQAYASPNELARTIKLGNGFSRYENITGMYLEEGENIVLVGETKGKEISLLIPNWMRKPAEGIEPTKDPNGWGLHCEKSTLKPGINIVTVKQAGNAYISYFDDNASKAPKIKVHFVTGKVNGYFDIAKHSNEDWDKLLENAVSPIMDARGKHIQVAYPVDYFKEFTQSRGVDLINNYDKMMNLQYTLMGLVKYKKVPQNRLLARVNFNYYMFRDGDGVAYLGNKSTMRMVAHPDVVIKGDPCWGFSHEVGHALQMRPQITWGGMTEVSNNIFSLYTTTSLGNESRLKAQKNYESARKNIIESTEKRSYLDGTDVFDRLVPFWQLHLYFSKNGKPDFYADVMEMMRRNPDWGNGNESINNQFQFIRFCCDVTKTDLTDFFDKWGFFWVGNIKLNDYVNYEFTITQEMVDETKAYIASKKYKKPATDITTVTEL
ncbi:MAG: M60 family metallopeptidase [Bacteroidales bacterium]